MNLPEFGQRVSRGGAVLAMVGTLALAAACGGGGGTETSATPEAGGSPTVSGEVQVSEQPEGAETPAPGATPERPAPEVHALGQVRDPFIIPVGGAVVEAAAPTAAASPAAGASPEAPAEAATPEPPPIEKPDIKVTGIVRSGSGFRAILTGPENSYIVAQGEKLGSYTVTKVTSNSVTLTFKKNSFTLPMEQEVFGPSGSKTEGESGGAGPGAGAPPPPPAPGP